ncbi:DUF4430 domain-containing protein [Lawsonibacter celer]|uniref:DUF4430 domain-containing protein n=1 Tax=Lawsonibacter celer TaxID=2986526 RepID=UPI00311A9CDF
MMWWKKKRWKVIVPVLIAALLAGAFWYGGGAPGLHGWTVGESSPPSSTAPGEPSLSSVPGPDSAASPSPNAQAQGYGWAAPSPTRETQTPVPQASPSADTSPEETDAAAVNSPGAADSQAQNMEIDPATGKDSYRTDPVPSGKPLPAEPQDAVISDKAYTCTLSISCASILDHQDWLVPEKAELIPEDGWILAPTEVTFYEGESVFNVLQRTCKQNGLHMEFEHTPMYNSAYIEGISNLYEFDCGERSGWMYQVNEWFPNYGCSRYALKDGDVVCWEYTCDLGVDIGGSNVLEG